MAYLVRTEKGARYRRVVDPTTRMPFPGDGGMEVAMVPMWERLVASGDFEIAVAPTLQEPTPAVPVKPPRRGRPRKTAVPAAHPETPAED